MAAWCLLTRLTPEHYLSMTRLEREVWTEEAKGLKERGWI